MSEHPELAPLTPGDRVGLVATSMPINDQLYNASLTLMEQWGLEPVPGEHIWDVHPRARYLAGQDEQRAEDLMRLYTDDSLAAVFCLRGGYGTMRLLDLLDVDALRAARPKPLIGSSDITGLHEFWEQRVHRATWFAPMFATKDLLHSSENISRLHSALFSPWQGRELTGPDALTLVPGEATGTVTGGNLSLIRLARGMDVYPGPAGSARGKIVLLEDVDEEDWRLDGALLTLIRSGYFDGVAGIGLGTWSKCGPPEAVRMVLEDALSPLGVPLIWGLPFGHAEPVDTIPLGVEATIVADDQRPRIVFGS